MNDDFISLQVVVVSEVEAERAAIRREAGLASIPIEMTEFDGKDDGAEACARLAQGGIDVVLCDSRVSKAGRQVLLDAARAAKEGPIVILIGPSALKTREVMTDGFAVDGVLAKPIDQQELKHLIDGCVRARLSNQVLIVDDSSTVRSVIRKVLLMSRRFRLNLDEVDEGAKAIAQAGKQRYDIVFLDCHMPGLDGFATLGEIRKTCPDTRVVMITGTRDIRIEDRARAEGANDFLYKPFFAPEVDAVLSRLFGLMRPRWN